MIDRSTAEAGVSLVTSALVAAALAGGLQGPGGTQSIAQAGLSCGVLGLLLLTVSAALVERSAGATLGTRYRQRAAASSGLALGALALPWVFAGLAARQQRAAAWQDGGEGRPDSSSQQQHAAAEAALHTCLAASAAAVLVLLRHCGLLARARPLGSGLVMPSSTGTAKRLRRQAAAAEQSTLAQPQAPLAGWTEWALAAALGATVAQAAAAEAARAGPWHGATVLAAAAAACACLHGLLAVLPGTFTLGEALVAAEAAVLAGSAALELLLPQLLLLPLNDVGPPAGAANAAAAVGPYHRFVVYLTAGGTLAAALLFPLLLARQPGQAAGAGMQQRRRNGSVSNGSRAPALPATIIAVAAAAVAAVAAAAAAPAALWALRFALSSRRRLLLLAWWAADLAAALPIMSCLSSSSRVPSILVRKGYHLLAVSLFLPALLLEPQLLGIALAGALAVLLAVEAVRLSGLPQIAARVHAFMTSFTDSRDSGPLLVTHFTLLLGMAAPIWLSNALESGAAGAAAAATAGGTDSAAAGAVAVWLPAYAGLLILGFGDTAASAVGSLLGRHPICRGTKKTVEGTAAAIAATMAACWLLAAALPAGGSGLAIASWRQLAAATALSCLLEAVTTQLDNIFMPLHYFALLCLL